MYKYTQLHPAKKLSPYFECYWIMEKNNSGEPIRSILAPNACSEIVVVGGSGYCRNDKKTGSKHFVKGVRVIGPRSNYVEVTEIQDGTVDIGFVFKPYGLKPFVDEVRQKVNKVFSIDEFINNKESNLSIRILEETLVLKKIELLENYFISLIDPIPAINPIIKKAISNIHATTGNIKVHELRKKLNVSKSTLERVFYKNIGISPKEFSDIWRLNYLINSQEGKQTNELTELAFDYGFFDQSHFIKFFKKYTGNTPKNYFSSDYDLTRINSTEVENRFEVY